MHILMQNIIQTFRSLRTQAWQVATSSVGLAVGIVCLTFSVNWFWTETNYDSFRPDYKNLYILQHTDPEGNPPSVWIPWLEAQQLREQTAGEGFEVGIYGPASLPHSYVPTKWVKEHNMPDRLASSLTS